MMVIFIVMIAAGACFILMMLYFLKSLGVLLYFLVALESVGVIVGVITIFFLKKEIRRFQRAIKKGSATATFGYRRAMRF